MTHRPGHFMPPALLDSQLATLEPPIGMTTAVLRLDGSEPIDKAIQTVLDWLDS
jgi:gluconokinase